MPGFRIIVASLCVLMAVMSAYGQRREIKVGIINGRAKYLLKPVLTKDELDSCASGQVKVEVLVGIEGKVQTAKAVSGNRLLIPSAVTAALQARFSPAMIDAPPLDVRGYLVYNFPLQARCKSRSGKPITITCAICPQKVLSLPKPDFPPSGTYLGLTGQVVVQVLIDENGKVISAKAVAGHPLLRSNAEKAARLAVFEPYTLSGKPVRVSSAIVYNFLRE